MKPDASPPADRPFEGGAFNPQLPDGRASGLVTLSFSGVRFESEKGGFELPLDSLKMELGGANDRIVFFSHPDYPQVTIHTADHAVFAHPVIAQTPGLAAQRGRAQTKKRVASLILLTVAGALVISLVGVFLGRSWFVKLAARTVPVSWEIAAGDKLFDQVMLGKREIKDDALAAQLKQLTDPLVNGIADKRYPLKFHIIEDASLNAFALPGGNVVVHSGLLLAADTPEEVAGVLAHEIAHVTRRHSIRNILSSAGLYVVLSAVIGDASGLVAVLANNSAFLLDRMFSRDFEREADDAGWDYLLNSDIEPKGMITFFQKMQVEEKKMLEKLPGGGGSGVEKALALISTHPATQDRIDRLEKRWTKEAKRGGFKNIPLNYPEFKDSLRAQLHSAKKDQRPE